MGIDWEFLLAAEDEDLQDAYDSVVDSAFRWEAKHDDCSEDFDASFDEDGENDQDDFFDLMPNFDEKKDCPLNPLVYQSQPASDPEHLRERFHLALRYYYGEEVDQDLILSETLLFQIVEEADPQDPLAAQTWEFLNTRFIRGLTA